MQPGLALPPGWQLPLLVTGNPVTMAHQHPDNLPTAALRHLGAGQRPLAADTLHRHPAGKAKQIPAILQGNDVKLDPAGDLPFLTAARIEKACS